MMRKSMGAAIAEMLALSGGLHTPQIGRHHRYAAGWYGFVHRSKYMPHQGKQECARRVRQMERAKAKREAA